MITNSFFDKDIFNGLAQVRISEKKDGDFLPREGPDFKEKMNALRVELNIPCIIAAVPSSSHGFGEAVLRSDADLVPGPAGIYRTKTPADGYIITTKDEPVILMYAVADCPTVVALVEIPKNHYALGLLHCGWKPLAAGILDNFLEKLEVFADKLRARRIFQSLMVVITPGIGDCCFVAGEEVINELAEKFNKAYFVNKRNLNGRERVDLFKICWRYFEEKGARDIRAMRFCTKCSGRFFSHRRGDRERNLVAVAFTPLAYPKSKEKGRQ